MSDLKIDLPLIPLRDVVVFPGIVTTLFVGRTKSVEALNSAMSSNKKLVLVSQIDPSIEDPEFEDIYKFGSISNLLQLIKLPDGTMKVLVEGQKRCSIEKVVADDEYLLARVQPFEDIAIDQSSEDNIVNLIKSKFEDYIKVTKRIPPEIVSTVDSLDDISRLIDTITGHLPLETSKKQEILEILDLNKRAEKLLTFLESHLDVVDVEKKIRGRVKKQMEKSQREYYLNEQIKAAQKELGEISDEGDEFDVLDKKIEQKRQDINKIKELIMKNELNKTYLTNDIEKSKINIFNIKKRIETYSQREKEYRQEEKRLITLPDQIQKKIDNYQGYCNSYESELVKNTSSLNQIAEELKTVEKELIKVEQKRENQRNEITKLDGILENTKMKEKELRDLIYKRLNKQPEDLEREKKLVDKKLDTHEEIKNYLQKITFQREQMGPVNLRAKIEESEIESLIDELELEKNDLVDALTKLRQAINKINHEGKNRLISAFEKVNKNFSDLFKKLFSGGDAKLELVKSDDPLQTGLEIFARPPGKKLSNISLLSGGEKTLTAIALIFSIFLINPSPICILDEVDAALDDVNIDKFCLILNELKNNTQTKFLIITHNKITMSSIDRVYGVTMPQKGISDIVSVDFEKVDLQEAI